MKALVTGGLGFIGSALVSRLQHEGWEVLVVDTMEDSVIRMQSRADSSIVEILPGDISRLANTHIPKIDVVFHFAAHYANERSLAEPLKSIETNVLGTIAVLNFCRYNAVPRLVYASSSGVYGGMDVVAYSEDAKPGPQTPYEVGKYSAEVLCEGFCNIYDISYVAPRFFNVYGKGDIPGQWRSVIPLFFRSALSGMTLNVTGKTCSRDFTYIDDVIDGVMAGLQRIEEAPGRISLIYNIATGVEVFIKTAADLIVKLTGSPSEVEVKEPRNWDNALRRVGDTHKFRALFPDVANSMIQLADGLNKSLSWYMDVCKIRRSL